MGWIDKYSLYFQWNVITSGLAKSPMKPMLNKEIHTIVFMWMPLHTVYPKKYAHGFVVLCFVVVMQSFIMNSHEVFIHIHQGCFAGTGAIVRLPQCQWSTPDGYGKISQCITTTKHSKAETVCIFLGIYCIPAMTLKLVYTIFLDNRKAWWRDPHVVPDPIPTIGSH